MVRSVLAGMVLSLVLAGCAMGCAATPFGTSGQDGVGANAVTVTTLAQGADSRITEARQVVIRDQAAWAKLWQEHTPDPQVPALTNVDFATEMVLGAFAGERATAGYTVTIEQVSRKGDRLEARVKHVKPAAGEMTAMVLTQPYHLVKVPKDPAEVVFVDAP